MTDNHFKELTGTVELRERGSNYNISDQLIVGLRTKIR
jgi:hypothetical protein